jgi:hypothetical protein
LDERLESLYLGILYILDDLMELTGISIFLDEEESIFSRFPTTPAGREREEKRIEGELETIFPFLRRLISTASYERVKSFSRLIVCDDELALRCELDTVDSSCDLHIIQIDVIEPMFEVDFSIRLLRDLLVEFLEIRFPASEHIPLGHLFESFVSDFLLETRP